MNIKKKLEKYISENLEIGFKKSKYKVSESCLFKARLEDYEETNETSFYGEIPIFSKERSTIHNLDDFIINNKEDNKFQKLLFKFIDNRNLKDSDVYNKVNIDRRLFSKIRNDPNYHPSKETIILLAIALELNEDELLDLLNSAEYSLPNNDISNLIIRFCFKEKIYNLNTINEFLYDYNCKTIC